MKFNLLLTNLVILKLIKNVVKNEKTFIDGITFIINSINGKMYQYH